jgi:hypothetical protein
LTWEYFLSVLLAKAFGKKKLAKKKLAKAFPHLTA